MKRQHRRRVLSSVLALATMTGAASFALGVPAQAKPIQTFIGRAAVEAFCRARNGTYTSWPGTGYQCSYVDRDGKDTTVFCPESGYGCEFGYAPAKRPKTAAQAALGPIKAIAKLDPQKNAQVTTQLIAAHAQAVKGAKGQKAQ